MEIESQSNETNSNSNDLQLIDDNIDDNNDYNNDKHLQQLITVNKCDLKQQQQTLEFDGNNGFNDITPFEDKGDLCVVSAQDDEDYKDAGAVTQGTGRDRFCWTCHKDRSNVTCKQCPRSYHMKCIPNNSNNDMKCKTNHKSFESWICIECKDIIREEEDLKGELSSSGGAVDDNADNSVQSSSSAVAVRSQLAEMSAEELSELLTFALQTIRQSADPTFHKPVSPLVFPDYHQLVSYPMDLLTIERNIKNNKYRSQMSFLSDIKWIVHNCIIYNHSNHPLTTNAKYLSRVAKNEMAEMEICPDCFKNFYTITDTSFAEPCRRPHQLVFARVKGYPLWPAKVVRLGKQNDVDCRFFGTHDRAWVAVDACWLVSEAHPGSKPTKTHKNKFEGAMRELALHIERLNAKFDNRFKYSTQKTPFSAKEIFIFEEDNEYYNKLVSEMHSSNAKSPKDETNDSTNDNNSDQTGEECVSKDSKPVIPGVFSLSSDKVLDEFKSEIKISNESKDLLNKNMKNNLQLKEDLSSKTRTARVGKRNVAEALRASKVQRTSLFSSTAPTPQTPHRIQANQTSILANNSHPMPGNGSAGIRTKVQTPTSQQSMSSATQSGSNLREELERLKKQIHIDNAMHREEIREIKHNSDLVLMEMRQSWVTERDKALEDERQKHELERKLMAAQFESEKRKLLSSIDETKRKQWCAQCLKEAQLFCCYDTWYCTYECQKTHWKSHVNVCQQIHKKS